ncbi:MAG: hypothetical protein AAF125_00810 [Chloroflexota bacterium]
MNEQTRNIIRNNVILSLILIILLHITGMMPYFIGLASAAITGDTEALIIYGVAAPGVVVGFFAGLLGLLVGPAPILIPVAIAYWLLKRNKQTPGEEAK